MKLSLGSGINARESLRIITNTPMAWKCIDICKHYATDECYDITEGIREADGTVDEIWMGDFLEHIVRAKTAFVLAECFRVMQKGGTLRISVPDMAKTLPLWLQADGIDEGSARLIWGDQDTLTGRNVIPDSHFNGFTENSLKKLLVEAGFAQVHRTSYHGVWFELAMEVVK